MKAGPVTEGSPVVTGSRHLGLALRAGQEEYGMSAGWESRARVTMPASGTLLLEWPANASPLPREMRDLFTVRVGTNLPPGWETPAWHPSTNQTENP